MGCRCYQRGWSYFCPGLDDDIFTQNGLLLSAPQPTLRPPITPSRLPSPDSFRLTSPTNSHRNFFFARLSQLVRLITRLYSVFAVWNSAASTRDVRRSIDASFSAVRSLQNSYQAARYCQTQWFSINISIQRKRIPHFCLSLAAI